MSNHSWSPHQCRLSIGSLNGGISDTGWIVRGGGRCCPVHWKRFSSVSDLSAQMARSILLPEVTAKSVSRYCQMFSAGRGTKSPHLLAPVWVLPVLLGRRMQLFGCGKRPLPADSAISRFAAAAASTCVSKLVPSEPFKNELESQPSLTGSPKACNTPAEGRLLLMPGFPRL